MTNLDSFEKSKLWIKELQEKAPANIHITLCANKIDLDNRQVTTEMGQQQATEQGLAFWEVSAKENIGVEEMFKATAKKLPETKQDPKKKLVLDTKPKDDSWASYFYCNVL